MSVPQEMMMQADAIGAGMDAAEQEGMQIMTPQGKFSSRGLNAVVDVVNQIMPMLGQQEPMPQYTEDMTMLPQELMQMIMAIMTIAEQAGVPIDMEMTAIASDNDLAKLSALMKRVVNDAKFKDFLAPGEEEVITEETVEPAPMSEGDMEVSDEELFASRI